MGFIGASLLLLLQVFFLALMAGGIASELGTMFKRATSALNLPQLHELAVAAESWLMVAALIAWAASVLILVVQAIKRGSVAVPNSNEMGSIAPIVIFLGLGIAVALVGGAGLLVAGFVHLFAKEEIADIAGLVAIAGIVGWMVGVTNSSSTKTKKT